MQLSDDSPRITSHFVSRLIGSLIPVPPENAANPPGVTPGSSVPCRPHTPWYDGWVRNAFAAIVPARPCPAFGRPVHHGVASSITARYFSASPSDSTSRWTPCPPVVSRQLTPLRLRLVRIRRFRLRARLDVSLSGGPGRRGVTPAFGYDAPYPGASGTSTHLIRALPGTHYGPLRLPRRPATTSDWPYTSPSAALTCRHSGSPALGPINLHHMPPLLPRKTRWDALVVRSHWLRPSPTVHRVGVFALFTRLHSGSLALRPAVLHHRNSRPPVTRTPLRDTTKVYE